MEAWLHTFASHGRVAPLARRAEAWGFDGLRVADSQNLEADVWVELALAGAATERIALGPGVTNPVTRHLAVTASAAATLQVETGGRAVLGLGRGDTALAQIGRKPVPTSELERALMVVQGGPTRHTLAGSRTRSSTASRSPGRLPSWSSASTRSPRWGSSGWS